LWLRPEQVFAIVQQSLGGSHVAFASAEAMTLLLEAAIAHCGRIELALQVAHFVVSKYLEFNEYLDRHLAESWWPSFRTARYTVRTPALRNLGMQHVSKQRWVIVEKKKKDKFKGRRRPNLPPLLYQGYSELGTRWPRCVSTSPNKGLVDQYFWYVALQQLCRYWARGHTIEQYCLQGIVGRYNQELTQMADQALMEIAFQ